YNVIVKETRVISAVAVKQGDTVEKDQIIYYLEDAESDELKKAEDELEELQLAYMKGLFGNNVSSDVVSKVASGNTDGFTALQTKVTDMQNRLEAAKERVKECQDALDALNLQSNINTNNASVSTIPDELRKDEATTELTNAEEEFNNRKAKKIAEIKAEITEVKKQIEDLETLILSGEGSIGDNTASETTANLQIAKADALTKLNKKLSDLNNKSGNSFASAGDAYAWSKTVDWETLGNDVQLSLQDFLAAYADYQNYNDSLDEVVGITNNQDNLEIKEKELEKLEAKLAEVDAITLSSSENVQDAKKRLEDATRNITEINSANKQTSVAYQNRIANAEAALKTAQAVYDLLKEEQTVMLSDINAELDLAKASKDIAEKEEEIAKLKEKSMGAAIKAPVAGTIVSLTYVAGETTKPEETAAVIQVDGKGFTLTISVTNDQAKKVQVGDVAELQNSWYYEDAQVILSAIKADPDNPGQKKLLVFNVTGASIQNGQALSVSVGQRSSEYEFVVPNSAMREDNNGKFILIVESKSSPLGNRYIATRVDVEVLASDDNNTAISAPLYGYEYVITTSTKPVEAGKQVRLNE
ncbi:MAG: hypothetical protein KIH00_04445, partial [Lachnospiraceae bacterium]|nr:hypothetical protein [Lachnospiraceae bacterium]